MLFCLLLGLAVALSAAQPQDTVSLDQVLIRAQTYVVRFQKELSGLVAEETYNQDSRTFRAAMTTTDRALNAHRALKSDLLLVKPEGGEHWVQFRDVFEVDGRTVRDRDERLLELFVKPTASTRSQADRIITESARYNIGPISRNINIPILALSVLLPENADRFQFARVTKAVPELAKYRPSADVWIVGFTETRKSTLIRGEGGSDVPARGRLWIEPLTGRVLATELAADIATTSATIDVVYGPGPFEAVLVPLEMREQYLVRRPDSRVDGLATYGRFRQFQVTVDEQLAPVKK